MFILANETVITLIEEHCLQLCTWFPQGDILALLKGHPTFMQRSTDLDETDTVDRILYFIQAKNI